MKQWITFAPADIKKPQTYANAGSMKRPAARLKVKSTVLRALWGCVRGKVEVACSLFEGGTRSVAQSDLEKKTLS